MTPYQNFVLPLKASLDRLTKSSSKMPLVCPPSICLQNFKIKNIMVCYEQYWMFHWMFHRLYCQYMAFKRNDGFSFMAKSLWRHTGSLERQFCISIVKDLKRWCECNTIWVCESIRSDCANCYVCACDMKMYYTIGFPAQLRKFSIRINVTFIQVSCEFEWLCRSTFKKANCVIQFDLVACDFILLSRRRTKWAFNLEKRAKSIQIRAGQTVVCIRAFIFVIRHTYVTFVQCFWFDVNLSLNVLLFE